MKLWSWIVAAVALVGAKTGAHAIKHVPLEEHRFVNIIGPITTSLTDAVLYQLNDPNVVESMNSTGSITLFINSPGGSVHAGSYLLQYIRALQEQGIRVDCLAENFMSMAFVLFQACDVRMVVPHAIGMQHQMSFALRGSMESIRTSFHMHDVINDQLIDMEREKIGLSRESYDRKVAHDWWIVGPQNLEENTADEMVVYSCAPELRDKIQTRQEKRGPYTFFVQHHQCPLYKSIEVSDTQFAHFYDAQQYRENVVEWQKTFNG